ncbi:MAG: hypothetical protein ACRDG4_01690 [Chloroflexota bacterium]
MNRRHMTARYVCAVGLVGVGWLAGSLTHRSAYAAMGCMSDPLVILSTGTVVHLYAMLPDVNVADVQSVTYTLNVPTGSTMVAQVNTDGLMGMKEHFQFSAAGAAGTYSSSVLVRTTMGGRPITATTQVGSGSSTVHGQVNQTVFMHLRAG